MEKVKLDGESIAVVVREGSVVLYFTAENHTFELILPTKVWVKMIDDSLDALLELREVK